MPEISQHYRQQRLAPLSGVGNLSASDIAAATQGNRDAAKTGEAITEFGMAFMEKKEKAEFHDQLNTAKTEYLTKMFDYEQSLQTNADTETYMPGLEAIQTSSFKITNKRAANDFDSWKPNTDLSYKRRVFGIKNSRDVQNYTDNWKINIDESTRRVVYATTDADVELEKAEVREGMFGVEYATDEAGEPVLDEKGKPALQLIDGWENTLLDTDLERMGGYRAWEVNADAKREVITRERVDEALTGQYQSIIDNGGTKEEAFDVILKAKSEGIIDVEQAQSLNSGVNGYASGKNKEATQTRNQKTTDGYHTASDDLVSGGATINSIKDLGLPSTESAFLEGMISKSHNKPDVETRAKGQDVVNGIVMKRSLEQMSDVEAMQATMTEYYDKKTISEETYNWTIDKIQSKYPRELVPTIQSKIETQGADWWGISEGEKVIMKRNRDFTDQVDKLLADENFTKKPLQDQIGIIEGEMAALKAGTPLQDPNDIVLDAPLYGFAGFPTKHPMVQNKDGSRSNVVLSGATLDDGRVVAFPTMIDGVKHTSDEALKIAEEHGIENYPFFDSPEALNKWAEANHANFDENGNLSKSASQDESGRESRIRVVSPDGVSGTIPASDLTEFISRGFKATD